MTCEDCRYYRWYWDKCELWDCGVDARSVCNHIVKRDTPIRNAMVGGRDTYTATSYGHFAVNMSDYTAQAPTSPPLTSRTCPNCGAPVSGSACEYCGSVFEKQEKREIIGQYHGKPVITHGERTVRRYNPDRLIWEYALENPLKSVETPYMPTKYER